MAVYRSIYLTFWQDEFVLSLTPEEKYFYLYLITNSKTSLCGIYELPKRVIEFETGYNRETVEKLLSKFVDYKKIHISLTTNEIVINNWLKYNSNRSPKVQSAVKSSFDEVKDKSLIQYVYGIDTVSPVTVTVTVTETETVTDIENKPLKLKKIKFGEYKHISLTDEQYQKLVSDYSESLIKEYITKIDEWIQTKGKSPYKDFNLAIRNWLNKDNKKPQAQKKSYSEVI